MGHTTDSPLRVLIMASGDLWAGAEAVVYQLVTGLHLAAGIQVSAVYLNEGRLAELSREAGVSTHVVHERLHGFASLVRMCTRLAREIRPHVIHSHRYKENILAALVAPLAGMPRLVTTVHGMSEVQDSLKARALSSVNRVLLGKVFSRVVAVSDDLRKLLAMQGGIPCERMTRIYNGMDTPVENGARRDRQGPYTVGSAGRLVPVKDFRLMVDVARAVCSGRDDVRFVLAGDGPELGRIIEKVRACGLAERFELLGHVNDMAAFFSRLDLYMNTSLHEGIPMAVIEAMMRGLPVVAPDVGGLGEVIEHGRSGFLVPGRDVGRFAGAVNEVFGSDELRQRLGDQGRERAVKLFSAQSMVRAYQDLYREVLSGAR